MYLQRSRGEALFGVFNIIFLIDRMGLTNTFWAMVIPFLVSPWNMLIMRKFFMALPESLEEAAIIDGATPLQTLVRIVLPLSTASIATIGLCYAVWHWNEWFYAFLYINDTVKLPLQVVLTAGATSSPPENGDDHRRHRDDPDRPAPAGAPPQA